MIPNKKVLLAATVPDARADLNDIDGELFDLKCVTRLADAVSALDEGVDAVLCNVHFDDGALFDLLRITKVHRTARSVPFFVIDASSTCTSPAITQSIVIASKALGADQVIHIAKWRADLGDREARIKTLNSVFSLIRSDGA